MVSEHGRNTDILWDLSKEEIQTFYESLNWNKYRHFMGSKKYRHSMGSKHRGNTVILRDLSMGEIDILWNLSMEHIQKFYGI